MHEHRLTLAYFNLLHSWIGFLIHLYGKIFTSWIFDNFKTTSLTIWTASCDFQQCGILTSADSYEPPFKLLNSKWCPVSSLTVVQYSSDKQMLRSDCAYAQADLRLCWLHIPHCLKSHVPPQLCLMKLYVMVDLRWNAHIRLLLFVCSDSFHPSQ